MTTKFTKINSGVITEETIEEVQGGDAYCLLRSRIDDVKHMNRKRNVYLLYGHNFVEWGNKGRICRFEIH